MTRLGRLCLLAPFVLVLSGCGPRVALPEALALHRAGRDAELVEACRRELARWRAVDPEVTAAADGAKARVDRLLAEERVLSFADLSLEAPALVETLAREGIAAGGGGGALLRALGEDLLSRSPLRILRAAHDAAALGLVRLVPHLVAVLYATEAPDGEAGPLSDEPLAVRMLAVKIAAFEALRELRGDTPVGAVLE